MKVGNTRGSEWGSARLFRASHLSFVGRATESIDPTSLPARWYKLSATKTKALPSLVGALIESRYCLSRSAGRNSEHQSTRQTLAVALVFVAESLYHLAVAGGS